MEFQLVFYRTSWPITYSTCHVKKKKSVKTFISRRNMSKNLCQRMIVCLYKCSYFELTGCCIKFFLLLRRNLILKSFIRWKAAIKKQWMANICLLCQIIYSCCGLNYTTRLNWFTVATQILLFIVDWCVFMKRKDFLRHRKLQKIMYLFHYFQDQNYKVTQPSHWSFCLQHHFGYFQGFQSRPKMTIDI